MIKGSVTASNVLDGSANVDTSVGGGKSAVIIGGIGGDALTGNGGNDTFMLGAGASTIAAGKADTVTDFVANTYVLALTVQLLRLAQPVLRLRRSTATLSSCTMLLPAQRRPTRSASTPTRLTQRRSCRLSPQPKASLLTSCFELAHWRPVHRRRWQRYRRPVHPPGRRNDPTATAFIIV